MKQNKKEELQSRREFFKRAAKSALPILGAIALANMPVIAQAATSETGVYCAGCKNDCTNGCAGGCHRSCGSSCGYGCKGNSSHNYSGSCDGCKYSCGGCKGMCSGTCVGSCSVTSYKV